MTHEEDKPFDHIFAEGNKDIAVTRNRVMKGCLSFEWV